MATRWFGPVVRPRAFRVAESADPSIEDRRLGRRGQLAALLAYSAWGVPEPLLTHVLGEDTQGIDAVISSIVFLGAAAIFLFTLEARVKRRRALEALHELRCLAHVIDMHQLAKDPVDAAHAAQRTASSPRRDMNAFELSRYLDYCSELLALVTKLGALYVRHLDDPVVLAGADGLQRLVDGLSQKIWHKMTLVDRIITSEEPRREDSGLRQVS